MSSVSKDKDDEFGRDYGLIHEAVITSRKVGWKRGDWATFAHNEALQSQCLFLLRGEARVQYLSPSEIRTPELIKLNRDIRPPCPIFINAPVHGGLENAGPWEYELATVRTWLHPQQRTKRVTTKEVYECMEAEGMLLCSLGLADGHAIARKPASTYKKYFKNKKLFLWRSVSIGKNKCLFVPYLHLRNSGGVEWIEVDWVSVSNMGSVDNASPAALLPKT